jgi:hypothetical protein
MNNCKNCLNPLKSNRGKSGLCQPCSARNLMNTKWVTFGTLTNDRLLTNPVKKWLTDQANRNNLKLSEMVIAIIKDAYFEDKKI